MNPSEDLTKKIISGQESQKSKVELNQEDTNNSPEQENNESLEAKEQKLKNEITGELDELGKNAEDIGKLAEDPKMPPSLKERVLESVNDISRKITQKYEVIFAATAIAGASLGTTEGLIRAGKIVVEEGSILSAGNEIALAIVGIAAAVEIIKFAAHKIKTGMVKREVKKGTNQGAGDAWQYFVNEGSKKAGVDTDTLPVSSREQDSLYHQYSQALRSPDSKKALGAKSKLLQ